MLEWGAVKFWFWSVDCCDGVFRALTADICDSASVTSSSSSFKVLLLKTAKEINKTRKEQTD